MGTPSARNGPVHLVRLFEVDPDLLDHLPEDRQSRLRRQVVAPVHYLRPGRWKEPLGEHGAIGILVLEGLLCRDTTLFARRSVELLGGGRRAAPLAALGAHFNPERGSLARLDPDPDGPPRQRHHGHPEPRSRCRSRVVCPSHPKISLLGASSVTEPNPGHPLAAPGPILVPSRSLGNPEEGPRSCQRTAEPRAALPSGFG
jgi:hypothetical protein